MAAIRYSAIKDGLLTAIRTGSYFDNDNALFLDMRALLAGSTRWAAVVLPGAVEAVPHAMGDPMAREVRWHLYLDIYLQRTPNLAQYQSDLLALYQEVTDQLVADDDLGGSCDRTDFSLVDVRVGSEEVRGRPWDVFTWDITTWTIDIK